MSRSGQWRDLTAEDGPSDTFIGRDKELCLLNALFAEATGNRPAVIMLDGEAGVGKSLLVDRFAATAQAAGAAVLVGGCLELAGGAIPYGPLVEALLGLVRTEGEAQARRLAGPAWTELADLIADFTTGGELSMPIAGGQTRIFGAVSRLLDHIGEHMPLVVVFEDVHWADTATLDLIAYLALTTTDQRLMLICSYRSGLRIGHPLRVRLAEPEFTRRTNRISLAPFTDRECRAFVAAISGGSASPERADRYFELSEGNPYFTEQLVAADDLSGPDPHVPPSLSDLMHARLAQLSADAMKVVQTAAVAGRRVSDSLLATVVGMDEDVLDDALTECLTQRVLVEDRADESYRFQHALLREAAYETLRTRERKRLHASLAEVLTEEIDSSSHVLPELAYHWFSAERFPEALRVAVRAGDLAMRLRAFQEAELQYRRALDLWPRLPDAEALTSVSKVRVLTLAADAARWAGHLRQAVAWAREAVDSTTQDADPVLPGELHERLGSYQWEAGLDDESARSYHTAHRLLSVAAPSAASSRVRSALATMAAKQGHYAEALSLAHRAEEEAIAVNAVAEVGRAKNSSGLALTFLGRHAEGIADLNEALRIAVEADHLEDMLRAYGNLGVCLERAGRLSDAVDAFQQGLDKSRELGLLGARQAGLLANNACAIQFLVGQWDGARTLIVEVLRYYPALETAFQRLTKAEIDLATGRFDDAERMLASVRALPSAQPRFLGPLYRCLAELSARRGDFAAALETVQHGIEAISGTEDHLLLLQLCAFGIQAAADDIENGAGSSRVVAQADAIAEQVRSLSVEDTDTESIALLALCRAEDRRRKGCDTAAEWAVIADAWQALNRPYPRAYALIHLASAAFRAGDRAVAADALSEATDIADQLGAAPLRERLGMVAKANRLSLRAKSSRPALPCALTKREAEVLRALARKGGTNREIGKLLFITKETVGTHLSNAYRKLGVENAKQAIARCREIGLLDGD